MLTTRNVLTADGALKGEAGARLTGTTIDVAVVRRRPIPVVPWVLSIIAEVCAVAVIAVHPGATVALVVAGLLHLVSAAPLAGAAGLTPSERILAVTMALALPVCGAPLAAISLATVGRAEVLQVAPEDGMPIAPPLDPDEVRRMAEALPACEALLAGGVDERRAIISTLTRRADADALALLRWALGAPDAELAVEAALALEDVNATFEARLDRCRRAMRESATFEAALSAATCVIEGIENGIADPSLVPSLAHEARACFEEAAQMEPARYHEVALGRARLELAVLRPDTALSCIDSALTTATPEARHELLALRQEAVLASHVMPWEGPSALASYRPAMPPPLTARRRLTGIRGTSPGRAVSSAGTRPGVPDRGGRSTTPRRYAVFPIGEVSRDRD